MSIQNIEDRKVGSMEEKKMVDLLSKIENTKRELEEFKANQGTGDNPGAGDNPPADDPTLSNIRKDLEGDLIAIPEALPIKETEADKHKFDVLQEKYNKEVPRLHSENKELRTKVSTLESTVEELRGLIKELKAEKPPVKEPEQHKATKYSKLNLEDFGDYDDGIKKIIESLNGVIEEADALKQENTRLKSENDAFKQEFTSVKDTATRASETVLRNSEKSFWGDVRAAAPKFDEYNGDANGQNADPRWGNFLDGFDPKTGEQFRTKASKAIQSGDSKSLISIVKQFETLIGTAESEDVEIEKKLSLDDSIVPNRGAGPAGSGKGAGKPITEKELDYAEKMMKAGKLSTSDFNKLLDKFKKQLQTGQGR